MKIKVTATCLLGRMPRIFLNRLRGNSPYLSVNQEPLSGPGSLTLSTFINRRSPSLKQGTRFFFFSFYLFSFPDIDDMPLSNAQFSEMDDISLTGSSRKSRPGLFTRTRFRTAI